jgi:uncharacterized protein (DUF2141 family)
VSVLTLMPTDTELDVHVEQQQDLAGGIASAVFDSKAHWHAGRVKAVCTICKPARQHTRGAA